MKKKFSVGVLTGVFITLALISMASAQLSIPTVIDNARIVIREILYSDTGIDDSTPYKIRVVADNGFTQTLYIDGDLRVENLSTPNNTTTYLVTTDPDGVLSFVDVNAL